ncbi:hypothetical protein GCM10009096_19280 [Parasphingorhabdus litoris]|uniref:Uncharacterized protein n=1 Tax=Parasphingorhabdus litoris TaxID=394733 RepID=A0ABN1AIP8_9SPHN|nr:hypothetical protein [Parasphingorhabdus litoris]
MGCNVTGSKPTGGCNRAAGLLRSSSILAAAFLICSGAAAKPSESKNQDVAQRIEALEKAIEALKADLPQKNDKVGQVDNASLVSNEVDDTKNRVGICGMASKRDFDLAFADPNKIVECDFNSEVARTKVEQARREATLLSQQLDNYSGISGRVNQALGFRGAVNFNGGDEASISYSHGIKGRKIGKDNDYQRPILKKITGIISTPISSGKNRLIDLNNGFDVTPGTSFKLAFDYQAYEKESNPDVYIRTVKFLNSAREACEKSKAPAVTSQVWEKRRSFVSQYTDQDVHEVLKLAKPGTQKCMDHHLINWIFKTKTVKKKEVLINKELAGQYINLFWTAADEVPIPQLGWGVSVEYAPRDFNYLQATFPVDADGNRSFDRTTTLIKDPATDKAFKQSTDNWVLEGYGSAFKKLYGSKRPKIGVYAEGIMGIASVKYSSAYDFPADAKGITVCNIENPLIILADCNSLNIDKPRKRSGFSGGLEGRLIFRNFPVVDLVGFAPKFEYRFDDGLKSLDLPLYVSANDKGLGTSGIRVQGNWGGRDLLGNSRKKDWGLSIFYSASLDFLVN